jgi:DNA polymerase I-like protein with 3'-5' exonuclease and polymerase domains
MPRDKSVAKKLFIDPPGWTLVEFDYAGVELRLASYYAYKVGKDGSMYDLFATNADVHAATANVLGAYEQIPDRKNARMVGKVTNLALLYGAGAGRLQAQLYKDYGFESTLDQCVKWHSDYHSAYPGLRSASNRYSTYHRRKGHIELWNGRRCRIRSKVPGLDIPHHDAFNRLVQGGCGVILMQALIRLASRINSGEIEARMCNTVHDSVWVYIPTDKLDQVTTQIIEVMETPPTAKFGIPFTVEPSPMTNDSLHWEGNTWQQQHKD